MSIQSMYWPRWQLGIWLKQACWQIAMKGELAAEEGPSGMKIISTGLGPWTRVYRVALLVNVLGDSGV